MTSQSAVLKLWGWSRWYVDVVLWNNLALLAILLLRVVGRPRIAKRLEETWSTCLRGNGQARLKELKLRRVKNIWRSLCRHKRMLLINQTTFWIASHTWSSHVIKFIYISSFTPISNSGEHYHHEIYLWVIKYKVYKSRKTNI